MMGGIAGSAYIYSSTIFSKPEGMRNGPTLPFAGDALCALAINQTHTFLVGGSSGGYRDEAYIYDLIRATWSEVSSMDQTRAPYTGGCGSVVNPDTGSMEMVVIVELAGATCCRCFDDDDSGDFGFSAALAVLGRKPRGAKKKQRLLFPSSDDAAFWAAVVPCCQYGDGDCWPHLVAPRAG